MDKIDAKQLQLAIYLRLNQLKREKLATLTYQNLVDTLFERVWKDHYPQSLSDAVGDVMNLEADQVVAYLSQKAIIESRDHDLGDYDDLLQDHS